MRLKRQKLKIPLLIGGATTSKKHTAVKIDEKYSGSVFHVTDASRSVSVVSRLLNPKLKEKLIYSTEKQYDMLRENFYSNLENINLIDLKIVVGYTLQDELVIADVIDNDSWRIWPHGDPKRQLDKQSFRDGEEMSDVEKKYKIVTEYVRKFNEVSS